eukprot:CAMPEP_0172033844 /NCGR_PEP_ID=MMETSP1041-20130122/20677_1 /TAXON_ID=464988 /ORGANISM="Hemiselmis andersenii, Strain CCMP439" /LENGTH=52 /DNA_ID=CAMNT_0012690693 /DNA_START=60 /DNA_END=215 /DNA_ORIENTATION=+
MNRLSYPSSFGVVFSLCALARSMLASSLTLTRHLSTSSAEGPSGAFRLPDIP